MFLLNVECLICKLLLGKTMQKVIYCYMGLEKILGSNILLVPSTVELQTSCIAPEGWHLQKLWPTEPLLETLTIGHGVATVSTPFGTLVVVNLLRPID